MESPDPVSVAYYRDRNELTQPSGSSVDSDSRETPPEKYRAQLRGHANFWPKLQQVARSPRRARPPTSKNLLHLKY